MGRTSDQIERQLAERRAAMEANVIELRARGRRARQRAYVVAGVAAGIGIAAAGVYIAYRLTRPTTRRERLQRLVPTGLTSLPAELRRARFRQVEEKPQEPRWERIAVRAATATGTALGSALAARLGGLLLDVLRDTLSGSAREEAEVGPGKGR